MVPSLLYFLKASAILYFSLSTNSKTQTNNVLVCLWLLTQSLKYRISPASTGIDIYIYQLQNISIKQG